MVAVAVPTANATMIIVLITKDGYWVAADGLKSHGFGKKLVCKIHETKFGILAKSGTTQGITESGIDYSTNKVVEELIESSATSEDFQAAVKQRYSDDIMQELVYLINDPRVTSATISRFSMKSNLSPTFAQSFSRTLVLLDTSNQNGQMRVLEMLPRSASISALDGSSGYRYYSDTNMDWDDVRHIYVRPIDSTRTPYPPSVHMFSIPISYEKPDAWVQLHPKESLLEMLRKGTKEHSGDVGPPYSIVHVILENKTGPQNSSKGKATIIWVLRGKCPFWDESVDTENTKRKYRNP